MTWGQVLYIHPGFLAGVIIGVVDYAIGLMHGYALGRRKR